MHWSRLHGLGVVVGGGDGGRRQTTDGLLVHRMPFQFVPGFQRIAGCSCLLHFLPQPLLWAGIAGIEWVRDSGPEVEAVSIHVCLQCECLPYGCSCRRLPRPIYHPVPLLLQFHGAPLTMSEGWEDWPLLGPGWKRRTAVRKSGQSLGHSDTYYQR